MENDNIIILNDDEGSEVEFEFLDHILYRSNEYVVLLPTSEDADDETESYVSVDNESTLQTVFEVFKERAKDTFNFVD